MTSQIPSGPVPPAVFAELTPAEQQAFTAAAESVALDMPPSLGHIAEMVSAVMRLISDHAAAEQKLAAIRQVVVGEYLAWYGTATMPHFKVATELAWKVREILGGAGAAPAGSAEEATAALMERWPRCPDGCGCRLGTDDADHAECGCDGPCTSECRESGYPDAMSYRDLAVKAAMDDADALREQLADWEAQRPGIQMRIVELNDAVAEKSALYDAIAEQEKTISDYRAAIGATEAERDQARRQLVTAAGALRDLRDGHADGSFAVTTPPTTRSMRSVP